MQEGKSVNLVSSGKIWPYAIGTSIVMVFGFCMATIYIAMQRPVEKSDKYMMGYHYADMNVNALIQAEIDFNKKYTINYLSTSLSLEGSVLKYKLLDLENNPVNTAQMKVVITRPNNHKHDQELTNFSVDNGVYSFSDFTLAKAGRWNIMAKITIGENERFYNLKADTRASEVFEY